MTIAEIKQELRDAFKDYKFFENDHHYEYKGNRVSTGVTTFIHEYAEEFDAETAARRVAAKTGQSVEEIIAEWEYKKNLACTKGSTMHEYVQSLWTGAEWHIQEFDDSDEYKKATDKIKKIADKFHEEHPHFIHIADELPIGDPDYDIASCVDHLFAESWKDPGTGKFETRLIVADYKTNTELSGYNKKAYGKKLKPPLQHLDNCALNIYYLQLSIYKYIIEKYTKLKVAATIIVYMSEKNSTYEIIHTPYLKDEVEKILEWKKWVME